MDQAELQAAIDALRGEEQVLHRGLDGGGAVEIHGRVQLTEPIRLYSGIVLCGDGPATAIEAASGFQGSCLIQLTETVANKAARVSGAAVERIRLAVPANSGIAAIGVSDAPEFAAINDRFSDLYLENCGIDLDCYSQVVDLERIYCYGTASRLLRLRGNACTVRGINREGAVAPTGVDVPLLDVSDASDLALEGIVLEGAGLTGKPGLRLTHCVDVSVDRYWCSPPTEVGRINIVELIDCDGVRFGGKFKTLGMHRRVSVVASRRIVWEQLPNPAEAVGLWSCIDLDEGSSLSVEHSDNRHGQNLYPIDRISRIRLDDVYHAGIDAEGIAGYVARDQKPHLTPGPGNVFADSGFAEGQKYWEHSGAMEIEIGESPYGRAMVCSAIQLGSIRKVYQRVTIPQGALKAAPFTLSVLARVEGPGYLCPAPGALVAAEKLYYHRIDASAGWAIVPQTIVPQAAGEVLVGWKITGHDATTKITLCRPWLGPGVEAWLG